METVNCFKCNKELETQDNVCLNIPNYIGIVYDGIIFRSHGNYGSAIFDPMPGDEKQMIEIYICDDCGKPLLTS
jgi:hypothetical protein